MTYDAQSGDGAQILDVLQINATLAGYSLVDPSEASVTPGSSNLTIDVADAPSGVRLGGPAQAFGGASGVSLPSPDPDDPRKALVYLDSTATVQVDPGTPAAAVPSGAERDQTGIPTMPIPDENFLPLAEVWIPAGASDIVSGDIQSRRMPFAQGAGSGLNADKIKGNDPVTDYGELAGTPTQTGSGGGTATSYSTVSHISGSGSAYTTDDTSFESLAGVGQIIEFETNANIANNGLRIRYSSVDNNIQQGDYVVKVNGVLSANISPVDDSTVTEPIGYCPPDSTIRIEQTRDDPFAAFEFVETRNENADSHVHPI